MGAALCSMTTRVCSDVPLGLGNAFSILYLDETKREICNQNWLVEGKFWSDLMQYWSEPTQLQIAMLGCHLDVETLQTVAQRLLQ